MIFTYPGQMGVEGFREGELTFPGSVQVLRNLVNRSNDVDIRLVCCCWGRQVGPAVCSTDSKRVRKALFWAPIQFWKLYEVCVLKDDLWLGQEEHREVMATPKVLDGITSFELSIKSILGTECLVAVGTRDEYVTREALKYFESLVPVFANFDFRTLGDCSHNVPGSDATWNTFELLVLQWVLG